MNENRLDSICSTRSSGARHLNTGWKGRAHLVDLGVRQGIIGVYLK